MSRDLAALQPRITRQDRLGEHRSGIVPERRDTRAPELRPSGDMRSAARGDGGAQELMRTLGLVQRGVDSLSGYAEKRHDKKVDDDTAKGAIDQASGNVDPDLEKRSVAYRNSVAIGRTMTGYQSGLHDLDERVRTVIENQDDPDLNVRQDEVRAIIDKHFTEFAIDPETGKLRPFLASPASQRWLAGAIREGRAKAEAGSLSRIEERFNSEALTHFGTLFDAQLEAGEVDIPALREILPPTLSEDSIRGVIISTVMARVQSLRSAGRREESSRLLNSVLDAPQGLALDRDDPAATAEPAVDGGDAPSATPSNLRANTAAPTARRSTGKPISKNATVSFVINVLEGGGQTVNNQDGGGTTRYGITQRHNPDVNVANLTEAQAHKIAVERYWQPAYDKADPAVAAIAFDAGFIHSKSFARELATKYANDPAGALAAYRARLMSIADKPDKSRFRRGWSNRLDRLGAHLGVTEGEGGAPAERYTDPDFQADPEPLDPIELAKRTPRASLMGQLTGGLALRPEERRKLLDYREQTNTEMRGEWRRERREKQDETHGVFMERLSGLGPPLTATEIAEARKRRDITPEAAVQLLNTIRADGDRARHEADREEAEEDRDRDERSATKPKASPPPSWDRCTLASALRVRRASCSTSRPHRSTLASAGWSLGPSTQNSTGSRTSARTTRSSWPRPRVSTTASSAWSPTCPLSIGARRRTALPSPRRARRWRRKSVSKARDGTAGSPSRRSTPATSGTSRQRPVPASRTSTAPTTHQHVDGRRVGRQPSASRPAVESFAYGEANTLTFGFDGHWSPHTLPLKAISKVSWRLSLGTLGEMPWTSTIPYKHTPVPVPEGQKWCHRCQQVKPVQSFYKDRRAPDGRRYCCRHCGSRLGYVARAAAELRAALW